MPFGLCNAPATFERLMNVVMAGLDPMICVVYFDDIIVHSQNLSAHLDRLRLLFDRLLVTGLKLKVSKCRLLRTEVGFFGHQMSYYYRDQQLYIPERVVGRRGGPATVPTVCVGPALYD